MYTITVIKNYKKIVEYISILDMFQRIKLCIYGHQVRPLRRLYKEGKKEAYASSKGMLLAFTPAGKFGTRNNGGILEYSHFLVLDFDKLSPEKLEALIAIVNQCEYTFCSFVSPSGAGLKVFVMVSTDADQHLQAFQSVKQHYEDLTGAVIDPSGKDISRLCFVSCDENLYLNPGATIFVPTIQPGVLKTAPKPPQKADAYAACIARTEQKYSFIEGSRHNFVFELALQLRAAGMAENTTLSLLKQDYNFNEKDVCDAVKSVYGYDWPSTHGMTPKAASGPGSNRAPKKPATPLKPKAPPDNPPKAEAPNDADEPEYPDSDEIPDNSNYLLYDLKTVEKLLKKWYETQYNEVTGMVEWREARSDKPFKRLDDHAEHSMFRRLNHTGQLIPVSVLHILLTSDFSRDFNPFTSYFKKLKPWDGKTDYIGQLASTVKTLDDAYWAFCFCKWFVAWIAGMLVDNIINHTIVVLVGSQGVGKSTWMKRLIPTVLNNYLGTGAFQTDSKDAAIQLAECGMIILDEFENLNRRDLASFKELITRPEIRIRRPYGRNAENLPHRASFIASVNAEQILTDTTGTRRYLCANVIAIDYDHKVDIDKAMAQGLALFKSGFRYWFDQEEIKQLNMKNEDFVAKSLEEEIIETWFKSVTRSEWDSRNLYANGQQIQLMTASEIAAFISGKARIMLVDNTIAKIGKIMKKLGFERIRKGNNYSYMVRMVNADVVEKSNHSLDDIEAPLVDGNNLNTRRQDDLFTANDEPDMPF
jgi:hypothetical protein